MSTCGGTPAGRQVRHRDHRPHPDPRRHRPGPAAGHGRGPLQEGVQDLARRPPQAWRDAVEVVAMDGFTGFKTATTKNSPTRCGDGSLPRRPPRRRRPGPCRRRVQQASTATAAARATRCTGPPHPAHRRRPAHRQAEDPPRRAVRRRRTTSRSRPPGASTSDDRRLPRPRPGPAAAAMTAHRRASAAASRRPDRAPHPRPDPEEARRRRAGLLRPARHLQRPTEAINGRLEHLRGSALGFRNLTNYIARSLLETGGFRPQLHPRL
jgi:hypothetical protein